MKRIKLKLCFKISRLFGLLVAVKKEENVLV